MTSVTQFETFDAWCVVEHFPGDEETLGQDTPKTVFVDRKAAYEQVKIWDKLSVDSEYFVKGVRLIVDIENLPERTCRMEPLQECFGEAVSYSTIVCSSCGHKAKNDGEKFVMAVSANYCPFCGAKVVADGE